MKRPSPKPSLPRSNNNIGYYRELAGWSLEEMAPKVPTSFQTLGRWERTGDVKVSKLVKIADVLSQQLVAKGLPPVSPADLVVGGSELAQDEELLLRRYRDASASDKRAILRSVRGLTEPEPLGFEPRKQGR